MRLIFGLGNPGEEYADTRHNLGYLLLDELCRRNECRKERRECRCLIRPGRIGSHEVLLARTGTWMNVSGPAARALIEDREVALDEVLVAYDDVDLEFGQLKLRRGGGAGGHRGVFSLIQALGDDGFGRLRMGLGRPPGEKEMSDWVLQPFRRTEQETVRTMVARAAEAAECCVEKGLQEAMSRFNRRPDGGPEA